MPRFAIASTKVCLPSGLQPAVITIDGERIESVRSMEDFNGDVPCDHLGDLMISPGVIDTHVHINEPGTDWEGFETATCAAAAGGITTIIDMPLNSLPVTTNVDALEEKRNAAKGKCRIEVGFYGGLVPENVESIGDFIGSGVFGIKAFLCDSGLPQFSKTTKQDLQTALPILGEADLPLLVHAELVDESVAATPTDERSYLEYLLSRPDDWEINAIEMLVELAREFQSPIHVVHVATGLAVRHIAAARQNGLPISFETCPHYLYFESAKIADGDTLCKCAPPIRSKINGDNLWILLNQGLINTIGSDHSPCPPEMKSPSETSFQSAWGGIAGLQFLLPVMATVAERNQLPPQELFKWLAEYPAQFLRMEHRKGKLAVGMDADIVVWDPDKKFEVTADSIFHRHKSTPYIGHLLNGKVQRTYVRGNLVFQNGNLIGEPVGQLLERPA